MKASAVVVLGFTLILISGAILAYKSLTDYPPILGSGDGNGTYMDYVVFFCFGLGGAGVLILLFAFFQWFTSWGPEHGIMVKRSNSRS